MSGKIAWSVFFCGVFLACCAARAADEVTILSQPPLSWFKPSAYLNAAVGISSADDPAEPALGHHDPVREEGTIQGIELGMSMRAGDHVYGFATHAVYYGADEEWDNEWEEAFLKLAKLPGWFELRGGRMLSRLGLRNNKHLHSWNTVDMPLVLGRFLGDDGLILNGGDATWRAPLKDFDLVFIGGYGEAKTHAHAAHEEEHEHAHDEGAFADRVATGRMFARYLPHDFHHYQAGVSVAVGDNGYGEQTQVYGLDFSFAWRENGLEPGGRELRWNTEVLYRHIDPGAHEYDEHEEHADEDHEDHHHEEEHGHEELHDDTHGEFGIYSEIIYTASVHVDVGCRVGYVAGIDDLGVEERFRVSPLATAYLDEARHVALRVQYNYDDLDHGDEHSVWAQLGLAWGGPEVR